MKNLCIYSQENSKIISVIEKYFAEYEINIVNNIDSIKTDKNYDLIISIHYNNFPENIINKYNIINIQPSLLPAFNTTEAIKDAYLAGVKVTGVTVHKVENTDGSGMILAQYPVLIDNYTNFNQLEEEILDLECKLYPLVIKSILEDKVFDIVELLAPSKISSCTGCNNHCQKCK